MVVCLQNKHNKKQNEKKGLCFNFILAVNTLKKKKNVIEHIHKEWYGNYDLFYFYICILS